MAPLAYYLTDGLFFAARGDSSAPSMHVSRVFAKQNKQTPGYKTMVGLAVYLMLLLIGLTASSDMASSDDILFAKPLKHSYRRQ